MKKIGVCPECGVQDSISVILPTPIIRVALESSEPNGGTGVNAIVYVHDRHDPAQDALLPKKKFYCENCQTQFDLPKWVD